MRGAEKGLSGIRSENCAVYKPRLSRQKQESKIKKYLEREGKLKRELGRLERRRKKAYEADKSQ